MNVADERWIEVEVEGLDALADGAALTFRFARDGELQEGFVLRVGDERVAFRNRCPHWGTDLDMGTGEFWSPRLERIYCRTHGALFRVPDGLCDGGPCPGMRLERFDLVREGDRGIVRIPKGSSVDDGVA